MGRVHKNRFSGVRARRKTTRWAALPIVVFDFGPGGKHRARSNGWWTDASSWLGALIN